MDLDSLLARSFDRYSNSVAIVEHSSRDEPSEYTYSDLRQLAARVGSVIPDQEDRTTPIALFMHRSALHVASILAAIGNGTPYFSINPMVSGAQIVQMLRTAGARRLLCDTASLLRLAGIANENPGDLRVAHFAQGNLNTAQQNALDKLTAALDLRSLPIEQIDAKSLSGANRSARAELNLILFTSGSTGQPRGVSISSTDLAHRIRSEGAAYAVDSNDRLLNLLPFSFDVGCNQLYVSLMHGARLVLLNSWLPADIRKAIKQHGVTGVSGVPAIWQSLLEGDSQELVESTRSVRYITISGGDMQRDVRQKLRSVLKHVKIYKTYGQTETFRSGMLMPEEFDEKQDSVGRPPPGVRVSILAEDGSCAGPDQPGEILHSGVGTMLSYVGDPKGTSGKLRSPPAALREEADAVVYTGDLGKIDSDGYLYILGRMDRMIKVRGNRVYPEEIEARLLEHGDVAEAAVVPGSQPDSLLAAVRPASSDKIDLRALKSFVSRRLPAYMQPAHLAVIDEFPRTASGKIRYSSLAAQLQNPKQHSNQTQG